MERFSMPTTVISGRGSVTENREIFAAFGKRAVIITGKRSTEECGALEDVISVLKALGTGYAVINDIRNNPDLQNVKETAEKAKTEEARYIIGIGGGSPLDAAKAVAALCTNDIEPYDLFEAKKLDDPLPVIAVPTTAGTGSEVTPYAVLTVDEEKAKKTFTDARAFPRYAFLDHRYTFTLGKDTTRDTAVDFFTHAFEGFISKRATRMSDLLAVESMKIFFGAHGALCAPEINEEVREQLLYGSMLAGIVISQTGTTALHGLGYELTCNRGITHGRANGMLFPAYYDELLRQNKQKIGSLVQMLGMNDLLEPAEKIRMLFTENLVYSEGEAEAYAQRTLNHKSMKYTPAELDTGKILRIYKSAGE